MSRQIIATIFAVNTFGALSCTPARTISGDGTVEGVEWMVPYINNGKNEGYRRVIQVAKPSADSVKTLRVKLPDGQTVWILIKDGDTEQVYADAANKCCADGTPVIASDPVPDVIIEDEVVLDVDGKRRFLAPFPALLTGQKLVMHGTHDGGVAIAVPSSYASEDALVTYLNANLSALGVFDKIVSAHGDLLRLASTTVVTASLIVELLVQTKTASTLVFPGVISAVTNNGVTSTFAAPVSVANISELIAAIARYFADAKLTATDATTLTAVGTGVPGSIVFVSGTKNFA